MTRDVRRMRDVERRGVQPEIGDLIDRESFVRACACVDRMFAIGAAGTLTNDDVALLYARLRDG